MNYTRRSFVKTALGTATLASFASTTPSFLVRSAMAAASESAKDRTALVVIQLSGGNDGLNTVVPHGDDAYARHRPTLRLMPQELHKIDALLGFHPQMDGFMRLYQEGLLSIVHGVGYPNPNQDHEGAMRVWHTADTQRPSLPTGWLGRAADSLWLPGHPCVPAMFIGRILQPFSLNAEATAIPHIRSLNDLMPQGEPAGNNEFSGVSMAGESLLPASENPWLDSVRHNLARTIANNRKLMSIAGDLPHRAAYPSFQLAEDLRTVAQLIRADLGIRIFFTELGGGGIGGFDNHANQKGNHCALLHQLSESVLAFMRDLQPDKLLDRVLLMTFSEFGRTLEENGRHGTGHGSAAPVFLAGGRLKDSQVGAHPKLTELENGGLKFHTDFRRLYATVLDQWLGIDSVRVLQKKYQAVEMLKIG